MIEKVTKATTYYVDTTPDGDNYWPNWRTNKEGTHWENLMGMSWEEMDPPQKLVDEFRDRLNETL